MKRDRILLAHGGGGALTRELIEEVIAPTLDNPLLRPLDDSAVLGVNGERWAFTTDSYVVKPVEFPGGDIGRLAICGTINDLAAQAARPMWLSLGLILEEGLPVALLQRILQSIRSVSEELGVPVVTGDTKVVERGTCDQLYINTAGIGRCEAPWPVGAARARAGDAVILSGPIGMHGIAVMSRREGIAFTTSVVSDCAPLWPLVRAVLDAGAELHTLRDPTRGGVAAAVHEIARAAGVGIRLWESAIPVPAEVRGACELLGLDPLTIANEGKLLVICPAREADRVVAAMRAHPLGREAVVVGEVVEKPKAMALLRTTIGGERVIDLPSGEDLPRIC